MDIPADVMDALIASPAAGAVFSRLPPSHRREYLDWIGEAKKADTRARRISGMIDKLSPREASA
jgi:uncharacterized protein YdeI (YjbR/CyaY-like superfamily)